MIGLSATSTETTAHHAETSATDLHATSIAMTGPPAATMAMTAHLAETTATTDRLAGMRVAMIAHHVATMTAADPLDAHTAAVADSDQAVAVGQAAVADMAADQAADAQVAAVDSDPAVAQAAAADSVAHEIEIDFSWQFAASSFQNREPQAANLTDNC
jgi:hypothetical protein